MQGGTGTAPGTASHRHASSVGLADFERERDSKAGAESLGGGQGRQIAGIRLEWNARSLIVDGQPDGGVVVQFKPLGTKCGDCHAFDEGR